MRYFLTDEAPQFLRKFTSFIIGRYTVEYILRAPKLLTFHHACETRREFLSPNIKSFESFLRNIHLAFSGWNWKKIVSFWMKK